MSAAHPTPSAVSSGWPLKPPGKHGGGGERAAIPSERSPSFLYRPLQELRPRDHIVLAFIASYTGRHGHPPSVRQIAKAKGIGWERAVQRSIERLMRAGFIVRNGERARGSHAPCLSIVGRPQGGMKNDLDKPEYFAD